MLQLLQFSQTTVLSALKSFSTKSILLVLVFFATAFNTINAQTALISRSVSNTTHCNSGTVYGTYLKFDGLDRFYTLSNSELTEYDNGNALFTGTITNNTNNNIIFHINVTFKNRTFSVPTDSPKANDCGNNDSSEWYYYTTTIGTLTGAGLADGAHLDVTRAGPSFQLGVGANQTEGAATFNASGWLNVSVASQPYDSNLTLSGNSGDFNFNLSGDALSACDNFTDGGKIGPYEVASGTFTASTIVSEIDPSGGTGNIQYVWLTSTDPTVPVENWNVISGATDSSYEPGEITETTYFLRCSRRLGCIYFTGESNIIAKVINGDGTDCNVGAVAVETNGNVLNTGANTGVDNTSNIVGSIDGNAALFHDNGDQLIIELDDLLEANDQLTISWKQRDYTSAYAGPAKLNIMESVDGVNFVNNSTIENDIKLFFVHETITLNNNTKFIKITNPSTDLNGNPDSQVDAISYNLKSCVDLGKIGNRVWEDRNGNGVQDDGETGIQGVFVFLEDTEGNNIPDVMYQVTGTEGDYLFENLPLGSYVVRFATPSGFVPTMPNDDENEALDSDASYADGRTETIELTAANNTYLDADAGYFKNTDLIGVIWIDTDKDGQQEIGDTFVEGVRVRLYKAGADMIAGTDDDEFVGEVESDDLGYYTFLNVEASKYYFEYEKNDFPIGFEFTIANNGGSDNIDSDVDPNTGFSDVFQVLSNTLKSGVDLGLKMKCDFIPSAEIGEAKCEGFPVDFEALPLGVDYTYAWEFLDDATNPVLIGTSSSRTTDFTWLTPGVKIFNLTVTNADGCSVSFSEKFTILAAEESVCATLLPVDLISFTANVFEDNKVILKWATASEENNDFFEIQRSTNGERFETIGMAYGNGTTELINNYDFIDDAPFFGRNYYRLKQIDFDGTSSLTDVQSVILGNDDLGDVVAYPNPTKGNTTLRVVTPFENDATIEVVSATGQILEVLAMPAGSNSKEINLSKYQPGFYFLNIKYNGFKKLVHRVLKVRD